MLRTVALVSTVVLMSILAASAGPVRFWDTPVATTQSVETADVDTVGIPEPIDEAPLVAADSTGGDVGIIATLLLLSLASLALMGRWSEPSTSTLTGRWRSRRRRFEGDDGLIESTDVAAPLIDVESASRALLEGRPSDSIIACWIELERAAIEAGIPSDLGETPSQYVERVLTVRSLDPGPISDLADLYREARFSAHDLTDSDRANAGAALRRISQAFAVSHEVTA